jgi:folate-binding protein YgfZ
MQAECTSVSLESLGVLRAHGPHAVTFLQGQLSNDIARLTAERSLLAGYHNPQGRVIALLRLVQQAPEDVLALLPRELLGVVLQRLGKFVLRAKVRLSDESSHWTIGGLIGAATDRSSATLPAATDDAVRADGSTVVCVAQQPQPRWLVIAPHDAPPLLTGCVPAPQAVWQQQAIASGEPQVYAATSEEFVAQMLNLDALGAISFEKGCYTGQEVIARAHYRGRVKRRMQRFSSLGQCALRPGAAAVIPDGRLLKIVDAVSLADGRCEFLAVTTLSADGSTEGSAGPQPGVALLEAQQLPLPYPLPS